jgi:hypothetical protein
MVTEKYNGLIGSGFFGFGSGFFGFGVRFSVFMPRPNHGAEIFVMGQIRGEPLCARMGQIRGLGPGYGPGASPTPPGRTSGLFSAAWAQITAQACPLLPSRRPAGQVGQFLGRLRSHQVARPLSFPANF